MGPATSDVCVIGGGVIGLATAATLRDRGVDVVCFERGAPGDGQSAGRTRQFRHLHGDPDLIALAVRARAAWIAWEQRFDRELLGTEGALRVGAGQDELDALVAAGVTATELDAAAAAARFPIAALPDGMVLWDPLAGAIRAKATIDALSAHLGDAIRRAEVEAIEVNHLVQLRTSAGVHRSARCVVCAGAGTDALVRPLGLDVEQERQAHVRLTFRLKTPPSEPLPCFSDRTGAGEEVVYALSDLDDRYAVGLAEVTTYPEVEDLATDVPDGIDVSSQRERIVDYVRRVLPGLDPKPVGEVLRLTTIEPAHPEDGFGVWRQGPVAAVAGPNLFKFAPVIGEQLAALVSEPDAVSTARGIPAAPSR